MTSAIRWGGLFVILGLAGGLPAREPDLLKQTQDRLRIEAQRLEVLVSDSLLRADKIGRTQPTAAVTVLRLAIAEVQADKEALTKDRRETLVRKMKFAMNGWSERADNLPVTPGPGTIRTRPDERRGTDTAKGIYDLARGTVQDRKGALDKGAELRDQKAKALFEVNRQVAMMMPQPGDITFPKDWKERSSKRLNTLKLTDTEKKIIKGLNTIMTIELEGKSFENVIDYLKEQTKLPIAVDKRALDELNITYDVPVNVKLKKVTLRTVLKRMLADLNLTYVMKDQTILITSPARAKEMLSTRVYSILDLMPTSDMRMPALVNQLQALQTAQMLVVMITQNIEPESWEINGKGGLGTITFDPARFALVVRQTAEMHFLMGLGGLR